jgi:hypothetical protein
MSPPTATRRGIAASLIALVLLSGCADAPSRAHRVNAEAKLHTVAQPGTSQVVSGTLTGTPNGSFSITFNRATGTGLFTVHSSNGTLYGTVYSVSSSLFSFRDTGEVIGGTGVFTSASSSNLLALGRLNHHLAVSSIRLTGVLYY